MKNTLERMRSIIFSAFSSTIKYKEDSLKHELEVLFVASQISEMRRGGN